MEKSQPLDQPCSCGSGKKAGECCKAGQKCDKCASGEPAGQCHYKEGCGC